MSWLSDIAGKAENFLNAMDKGAASAINQATTVVQSTSLAALTSPSGPGSRTHSRKVSMKSDLDTNDSGSMIHFGDTEFIETPDIMSLKTSTSTNSLLSANGNNAQTPTAFNRGHQRNSSYDSVGSRGSHQGLKMNADDDRLMDYLNTKESNNIPEEEPWRTLDDGASSSVVDDDNSEQPESNIQTQAKIAALSKELSGLQKRYADLVTEYKTIQRKAITYHNSHATAEKSLKEARSRESDLSASLQTKDSQIAGFKVSLEQLEADLRLKTEKLFSLEEANASLRELASNKPEVDQEVVSALEAEIRNLKSALSAEREELKRIQESTREQVSRLEDTQRSLVDEIESARRALLEAKNRQAEAELEKSTVQKRAESLETEFAEFRTKATKTLADKEEMIRVLQGGPSGTKEEDQHQQSTGTTSSETLRLLTEQTSTLSAELSELQVKYDQLKVTLDRAENESLPRAEFTISSLKDQLSSEQKVNSALKNDVRQLSEEAKATADDLNQIRASLSARIVERDEEIEKLRKQLVLKQRGGVQMNAAFDGSLVSSSGANASTDEWEQRLKSLTENLIQKQGTVEHLSSANHSLKLQLERSELRLKELTNSGTNLSNDVAIGIYHSPTFTKYIKHRMGSSSAGDGSMTSALLNDDPNDGHVTRKVKRAYGAIDGFSIRLGTFLRVYPSARAAFLVYILVLHLWVAFVLLYYEPEVHTPDFHHSHSQNPPPNGL